MKSEIDGQGHDRSCPRYGEGSPAADPNSTHVDLFCDCHRFLQPKILMNATDIAWPAGWGEKQAEDWRRKNGLARPSEPGSGP